MITNTQVTLYIPPKPPSTLNCKLIYWDTKGFQSQFRCLQLRRIARNCVEFTAFAIARK